MSRMIRIGLLVLVVGTGGLIRPPAARAEAKRFDSHQVVQITIADQAQLETLLMLEAASEDFDIWTDGIGIGPIDVRVSADQKALLDAHAFTYQVIVDDVQMLIDSERSGAVGFFEDFRTYDEHVAFLNNLVTAYPDLAQMVNVGTSIDGRPMWAIRITGPGTDKPGVLYHGCQHAREWLTPPVVTYAAEHLLTNYDSDPIIAALVDSIEWYLMPVMNPDGYEYTWTHDRMWRKNRRYNGDGTFGVDLNRNWGYAWGGVGSSGQTNSEIYRGPSPFSEPETQVIRDFLLNHPEIRSYYDIHTTGNYLMWPWGYTSALPLDHPTFSMVATAMADMIAAVHGLQYTLGTIYNAIYPVSGGSVDWVYGAANRWGYTAELRGPYFIVPANKIILAAEENLPAMLYLGMWTAICDPYGSFPPAAELSGDCNDNGIVDVCEIAEIGITDCNANFIPDECDLAAGVSDDCNDNGQLDVCDVVDPCGEPIGPCPGEGDCCAGGGNGTPGCECASCCDVVCSYDPFCCEEVWDDLCAARAWYEPQCYCYDPPVYSLDCNENLIPDECEPDCNNNGVADPCDITDGTSESCDDDEIPDECEPDTDGDGVIDDCDPCPLDVADDSDGDGVCDSFDVCPGFSDRLDADGDWVPDGCDLCSGPVPGSGNDKAPGALDDDDDDGFLNCNDRCAGVDDAVFKDCRNAIPTVSEWGLVIITLLLLTGAKIYFGRVRLPAE